MTTDLSKLAERLDEAAQSYERVLEQAQGLSPGSAAISGALVMTMHGHLFAQAAAALRAHLHTKDEI